ncbi:MAG TPA: gamma carbonic anhydrase family protein [Thiopseudomonas sp.]|nr:gamma carbonic anhydrase family protein [Thiopseudomonas sp.]
MSIRAYKGIIPHCGSRVFIDSSAVVIGDVHLADDCSVWPHTVIRGDMQKIRIGARSSVQDGSVLHITHASTYNPEGYSLSIGEDVTIGHQVLLHGCSIGSRVLVGMGSIVMDGARIDDDVVLAAGSLVSPGKHLASGYLYMGRPAQQIRPLTAEEMSFFTYTAGNYVRLKDEYLAQENNR